MLGTVHLKNHKRISTKKFAHTKLVDVPTGGAANLQSCFRELMPCPSNVVTKLVPQDHKICIWDILARMKPCKSYCNTWNEYRHPQEEKGVHLVLLWIHKRE